jgi:hypothetical protein
MFIQLAAHRITRENIQADIKFHPNPVNKNLLNYLGGDISEGVFGSWRR